jgi:hypothetical protein
MKTTKKTEIRPRDERDENVAANVQRAPGEPRVPDEDEASEESFPASDPPARVATTGSQVKTDGRRAPGKS